MIEDGDGPYPKAPRVRGRPGPDSASGRYTTNRKGKQLCDAWNAGTCERANGSAQCPRDATLVHQCALCLDDKHGAVACTGNGGVRGIKGKGRGKGKKGKLH